MTKKDYIKIADVIKSTKHTYSPDGVVNAQYVLNDLALAIAEMLCKDNEKFNTPKFINYINAK